MIKTLREMEAGSQVNIPVYNFKTHSRFRINDNVKTCTISIIVSMRIDITGIICNI